ncbi:MAG: GNAT family N-acetyltransferase [Candidatus Levybacteria bacterium]|nr:GNAT family N-acetyltransferase [Candidatus Levybacteria bacterium]
MKDLTKEIIFTDRLKLVALSEEYAADIFENFSEEITTFMNPRSPKKIEEVLEYIHTQIPKMERGEELPVIILDLETGEFLGGGGAHQLNTSTPELGIWIKKSAHGKKYGREAVTALKLWIDEHVPYTYIKYPVDKKNISSRKIAESLGGVVEDEYKKTNMSGNVLDEVEYRIYKQLATGD